MGFISGAWLHEAVRRLGGWADESNSQTCVHLWILLAVKERGAEPGQTFDWHEPFDFDFWDRRMRVSNASNPYFDPLKGDERIASHPHSNVATARNNTWTKDGWKLAQRTEGGGSEGQDSFTLADNYADILAEKLKKGGSFAKVPALAVAVWLFRGDELDDNTSPAALIDQLKSDFHFTDAEWMKLFDTSLWSVSTPLLQPRRLTRKQQRDLALTAAAGDELATVQSVDSAYPSADIIQQLTQLGRRQVILQGPPGSGKTRLARQVAGLLLGAEQQAVDVEDTSALDAFLEANRWTPTTPPSVPTWAQVQFHANFGYEDFVRGIVPTVSASGNVGFEMVDKVFTQLTHGRTSPSVLLVDEINRADVARVFGELLFALEYRGVPVRHMYQSPALPSDLCVPSDFYMICTANSADRSIAMLDYAFRRRFDFVDVPSSRAVLEDFLWSNTSDVNVERVIALYVYVTGLLAGNPLLTPGHSYLMRTSADEIAASIAFQVLPLLSEYADEGVIDPLQTLEIPDPDAGSSALSLPLRRGSVELVPGIREWIASP